MENKDISPDEMKTLIRGKVTYAIVDPICAPQVSVKLQSLPGGQSVSLLAESRFEGYTAIAPCLMCLDEEGFQWITGQLWDEPWGIFVFSRLSRVELFHHFRHFVMTVGPDGSAVLVRFYDPRILPTFLASDIVSQSGFWDGMIAYGVGQEAGVKCIRPPEG